MSTYNEQILRLALDAITKHFDTFVGECIGADGTPVAPSRKALAQARACLPTSASHAFGRISKKDKP